MTQPDASEQGYLPTDEEMKRAHDGVEPWCDTDAEWERWLAAHDAKVRADERAKRPDREQIAHALWAHEGGSLCRGPICRYNDDDADADYECQCMHCWAIVLSMADAVLALEPEAREEVRHFAPYGSREATCGVAVPKGAAPPTTGDTGIYSVPRFTTRRAETTCSECRSRAGITDAEAREVSDAEVEAGVLGYNAQRSRQGHMNTTVHSSCVRAALEAAREVSRG